MPCLLPCLLPCAALRCVQAKDSAPAPRALFQLAAGLVQCGAVKLDDLLAHLGPAEDALKASHVSAGTAWHGMVRHGMAWCGTARHGRACTTP